ncbi:asparagine synthase-related protein [Nitrolancea hollandica]|uniref:asparagine synthase (glutamine-hydrolyzing) n=1 Tax=Nitrolancea hollandica Lb TaxID=1129897 RepID=I4EHZ4_9BACT|nr:asparagine synthase-related protein [Nitrolancea hollandica]CCF84306.1 putative Asparagine synthase,glutamine-hydrolyzing [Nitrolancea hollandica Lb]
MPGIVGYTSEAAPIENRVHVVRAMQDLITHGNSYRKNDIFCDDYVCATRSHSDIIQQEPQPFHESGVYAWLDGEFFNHQELCNQVTQPTTNDAAILATLYQEFDDFTFLALIDGIYSAALYDSTRQKIHLISDRYGLRYLYWTVQAGSIAWASETKAMLALPTFKSVIDRQAIEEFMSLGYLLEDRTWFDGVELLSPGTVLTWDIQGQRLDCKRRYWSWHDIQPMNGKIDEREVASELGRLFVAAVERRSRATEKIGIHLSGGRDSRAILAAFPDYGHPIHALTFGTHGCDDVQIAATVAREKKSVIHHVFEIDRNNWLPPRVAGVWHTDGQFDLMHMHGIEATGVEAELWEITLDGFAGDMIGGESMLCKPEFFGRMASREAIAKIIGCRAELLNSVEEYACLPTSDFFHMQNCFRRLHRGGINMALAVQELRMPFMDNQLFCFAYSLPDSLRAKGRIYNRMLLQTFPNYFRSIPWSETGVPISWPGRLADATRFARRVKGRLTLEAARIGLSLASSSSYTDYPNWIRQEPARSFFRNLLLNRSPLYADYIPRTEVLQAWTRHMKGGNYASKLCRYLTLEIWLQQIFESKYRRTLT